MANQDTTFRLKFENEDMKRVFDELIDKVEQQEQALNGLGKTQREYFDDTVKASKKASQAQKEQVEQLDTAKVKFDDLKDAAEETFDEIAEGAGQSAGLLKAFARVLGPIGLALTAIGAAGAAAFLDVRENAKAARREMAGIQAVGEELKKRTFAGIRAIAKQVMGDLGGAALEAGKAINGVNGSLQDVRANAKRLFDAVELVSQVTRNLRLEEAERANTVEKLLALSADETKTTEERVQLIRRAAREEIDLNNLRQSLVLQDIALLKAQNKEWQYQPEILDQINELEVELSELRGANQLIGIQTQQEVNALLREEAEQRERIVNAVKDFQAAYNGEERERAIEKQIELFEELKQSIQDAGLGAEFEQEIKDLDEAIGLLGKRTEEGLIEPLEKLPNLLNEVGKEGVKSLEKAADEQVKVVQKTFDKFITRLSPDQKNFIQDQLGDIAVSIGDLFASGATQAIQEQEALIEARQDAISELERQLSEEQRLQEQGFANNTELLQRQLKAESDLLQREQQKRLQIEKKAARQRIIQDSLQQASSTGVAVANLLAQGAKGFIPGLIIATGAIALLFRILAQSKAQAVAVSKPPQFREGTPELIGPKHERGGILIEAEGGERILSAVDNAELGGRAMTNEELVRLVRIGQEIEGLGEYSPNDAIQPVMQYIQAGAAARREEKAASMAEQQRAMTKAINRAIEKQTKSILDYWKTRPIDTPLDASLIREFYQGSIKVKEVIRPE